MRCNGLLKQEPNRACKKFINLVRKKTYEVSAEELSLAMTGISHQIFLSLKAKGKGKIVLDVAELKELCSWVLCDCVAIAQKFNIDFADMINVACANLEKDL